jgi:hypothetical protein
MKPKRRPAREHLKTNMTWSTRSHTCPEVSKAWTIYEIVYGTEGVKAEE